MIARGWPIAVSFRSDRAPVPVPPLNARLQEFEVEEFQSNRGRFPVAPSEEQRNVRVDAVAFQSDRVPFPVRPTAR